MLCVWASGNCLLTHMESFLVDKVFKKLELKSQLSRKTVTSEPSKLTKFNPINSMR